MIVLADDMPALADERNASLTTSCLRGVESAPETRRPRKSDWWYVENSSQPSDASTDDAGDDEMGSSTRMIGTGKTLRPVRKDSVGITLDGDRKVLLQQWECVVLERKDDVVCCEFHDLTDERNPLEYAEVLLDEFNSWDLPLLVEGAVFYWSLGHLRRQTGQVKRFSEFRLRRMPKISKAQQREITRKVKNLSGLLLGK